MKVILAVGGGIAAYKSAELARLLMQQGHQVQVVMTSAAEEFVRPLTFAALTGQRVLTNLFAIENAIEHIAVAQEHELLVVAPATADLMPAALKDPVVRDLAPGTHLFTNAGHAYPAEPGDPVAEPKAVHFADKFAAAIQHRTAGVAANGVGGRDEVERRPQIQFVLAGEPARRQRERLAVLV